MSGGNENCFKYSFSDLTFNLFGIQESENRKDLYYSKLSIPHTAKSTQPQKLFFKYNNQKKNHPTTNLIKDNAINKKISTHNKFSRKLYSYYYVPFLMNMK